MAGMRGNQAWLLAQKQPAKGTAATIAAASAYKMPFTGGNIGPVRNTDTLAETDSNRDRGQTILTSSGVEGSPEFYVRGGSIGFWLWAALGADAVTGTMPNYSHAITPANTLPWVTLWRDIADTLYEQYRDCKVGSLTISGEAGGPLTATAGIVGLQPSRLTASPDTGTPITIESSKTGLDAQVLNFNNATVTLSGGATASVRSFELTIENNLTSQQTDDLIPYDIAEGVREVSLSFDLLFETLTEYNQFHYGGAAGTSVGTSIYTTAAIFDFNLGANNGVTFNLPSIAYTEFPVEPNAGGDPITASIAAAAQRGASPVVTATVKNQVATY